MSLSLSTTTSAPATLDPAATHEALPVPVFAILHRLAQLNTPESDRPAVTMPMPERSLRKGGLP